MSLDGTDRASELARATAEHLKHGGFSVLEKGVSVDRVAELMYISRSAVHSSLIRLGKRGSDNGLLRNLSEHWLDPDRTGATRQLAEAMKQGVVETPDADPVETIKAMCDVYFTEVSTQPVAQVQLSLWLGRDDPDVAKRLQNIYSDLDMIVADLFDSLLAHWSRMMRPGFSTKMLAVSMGALVEGLVVRQAVDPDAVSDDLFGIVLLGLRPARTQDVNEPPSPFQSVVSQYTRPPRGIDCSSANGIRTWALEELMLEIRQQRSCRTVSLATLAERMRMDGSHLELIVGSVERLVADEVRSVAEVLLIVRGQPGDSITLLVDLASDRPDLIAFFLMCAADPQPAGAILETLSYLGASLTEEIVSSRKAGGVGSAALAEAVLRFAALGVTADEIRPLACAFANADSDRGGPPSG